MNSLNRIGKYCFWTDAYKKRKEAKWRIKLYKTLDCKVVLKQWEHRSWGNNIQIRNDGRIYGHISGVRGCYYACDIERGDILIYEIDEEFVNLYGGKYDVGCLVGVKTPGDPADMFFAYFVRICFTDDISDIRKLVSNEIKKWEKYI